MKIALHYLRKLSPANEVFASTFSFSLGTLIRLGTSLILTRLLSPDAYGLFGVLLSIIFVIEMLSDVGYAALLIRHPRGSERRFVHTVWTIRLIRSGINFLLCWTAAPYIAGLYNLEQLSSAIRLVSFGFLITPLESMAYIVAVRDRRARISNYAELAASAITGLAVVITAHFVRSYVALAMGYLLQRTLLSLTSHFFYRSIGVGFAWDKEAIREQFGIARYTVPSSIVTILLAQYDKLILLKFFSLAVVGVYTLASNIVSPLNNLIMHNARAILYARCADYFRSDPTSLVRRYYAENKLLLLLGMLLPACVGGAGPFLVALMYDPRYLVAGHILTILSLGSLLLALQQGSENLLVATGRTYVALMSNVIRAIVVVPASIAGYYLFGLEGFLWFSILGWIVLLAWIFRVQHKAGLLGLRQEFALLAVGLAVFAGIYAIGWLLLLAVPDRLMHLGFLHRH